MTTRPATDPALWALRPVFGVAGGPLEVVLTEEGTARAFSVGAQVRRGPASDALLTLATSGESGRLAVREGVRLSLTALGKAYSMPVWGVLEALGYVAQWHEHDGDGVRLTDAGWWAVENGRREQARLLERCRMAADATPGAMAR